MEFNFSEDQLLLQQTAREFLSAEHTPELIRKLWDDDTSHSPAFWKGFAEIGIPGLLVDESAGGLGMDEIDLALLLEETGRAAMPETVVSNAVGVRLLQESGAAEAATWLEKVAGGDALLGVATPESPFVVDADIADLLLLFDGDDVHAVPRADATLTRQAANDPSRRLFSVEWTPADATRIAVGSDGAALQTAALDRGAFGCAAAQLGVGQTLIDMAAQYACQREQFGVAIGTFQAVKHMLADLQVKVEYARSVVYRAAHSVARNSRCDRTGRRDACRSTRRRRGASRRRRRARVGDDGTAIARRAGLRTCGRSVPPGGGSCHPRARSIRSPSAVTARRRRPSRTASAGRRRPW